MASRLHLKLIDSRLPCILLVVLLMVYVYEAFECMTRYGEKAPNNILVRSRARVPLQAPHAA